MVHFDGYEWIGIDIQDITQPLPQSIWSQLEFILRLVV